MYTMLEGQQELRQIGRLGSVDPVSQLGLKREEKRRWPLIEMEERNGGHNKDMVTTL